MKILMQAAALGIMMAVGSTALAQTNQRIPTQVTTIESLPEKLRESEIVVVGLVNSLDPNDLDNTSGNLSTPGQKLAHHLGSLRDLGDGVIPNSDPLSRFSDKISILVVENAPKMEGNTNELHQTQAKAIYKMWGPIPM